MSPLVSVIIPVHNRLHLLQRALGSVFAQEGRGSLFDLDVVVIDDASNQVSENDVRAIIGILPVRYIRHAVNRGLSAARNTGIRATCGELVAFLDDDDEFLPHKLRTQVPVLVREPSVAMIYNSCIGRGPNGVETIWRGGPSGLIFWDLLKGNFIQVGTVLVRRTVVEQFGGFDEGMKAVEDFDLWLQIAHRFAIVYIDLPVCIYAHSAGKYLRDLEDGTALQGYLKIVERIASYAPREANSARHRLLEVWISNVLRSLPTDKALFAIQHALFEYPELVRAVPIVGLLKHKRVAPALLAVVRALSSSSPRAIQRTFTRAVSVIGALSK